jgi:hypothetical protein
MRAAIYFRVSRPRTTKSGSYALRPSAWARGGRGLPRPCRQGSKGRDERPGFEALP